MKKIILSITLLSLLLNTAFAQEAKPAFKIKHYDSCRELFHAQIKERGTDVKGSLLLLGWGIGFGALLPIAGLVAVPTALGFMGLNAVRRVKTKHMEQLIIQSEEYVKNSSTEGKFLRRLQRKVSKFHPAVTSMDLAQSIVAADKDMSLCGHTRIGVNQLGRGLSDGSIRIFDIE